LLIKNHVASYRVLDYYVDSNSIFRFIEKRGSIWSKHYLKTDEVDLSGRR